MKNLVLIIISFTFLSSFSQQMTYVDLNLQYDIDTPQIAKTDSIDIDNNSVVDVLIHSWFLYDSTYNNLGIEVLVIDYDGDFSNNFVYVKDYMNNQLIQDCHFSGDPSLTAFIYTNDIGYTNYTSEYIKIPFQFEKDINSHCGFLFVRYEDNIITIEGYSWNEIPKETLGTEGNCTCDNDYLSVENKEKNVNIKAIKYYNLMGQEVENPEGLTIVIYENGTSKKVFF